MPGFFITNKQADFNLNDSPHCISVKGKIMHDKYCIYRNTLVKFINDKIFYEDDDSIIVTEGVVLNKTNLINNYKADNFESAIKLAWKELGVELPTMLLYTARVVWSLL